MDEEIIVETPKNEFTSLENLTTMHAIADLFDEKREVRLAANLRSFVSFVSCDITKPELKFHILDKAQAGLEKEVRQCLTNWTNVPWSVLATAEKGDESLTVQAEEAHAVLIEALKTQEDIVTVLKSFPKSELVNAIPMNHDLDDEQLVEHLKEVLKKR